MCVWVYVCLCETERGREEQRLMDPNRCYRPYVRWHAGERVAEKEQRRETEAGQKKAHRDWLCK